MAIQTTEGIVLRKQNLRETSIILKFFTRDFGKISGVIKGARGPSAAIGHNPQAFSQNSVVFYERKKSNLSTISHCDLLNFFEPIRSDLERTIYADYFLELVDTVTIEGTTVLAEVHEDHDMRFFFPLELDFALNEAGLVRSALTAYPEVDRPPGVKDWCACLTARRFGTTPAEA